MAFKCQSLCAAMIMLLKCMCEKMANILSTLVAENFSGHGHGLENSISKKK